MTTELHEAVAELIRAQRRTINVTAGDLTTGLNDEDAGRTVVSYRVDAPCLLAQLQHAVATSTGGRGGRTVAGSRLPLAADALDLWVEITSSVHTWADALRIDRRPYRAAERVQFVAEERLPGWLRRLHQWSGRDGEELAPLPPAAPAVHRLAADDPIWTDRAVPPIGQLLRAVGARAESLAVDEVTERITSRARSWAGRIRTMLAGEHVDERIFPIRGETCGACGASSAPEVRDDGGTYWIPAVQVRFLPVEGGEPDQLWAYRMCVACGDCGWVDYTTETPGEAAA